MEIRRWLYYVAVNCALVCYIVAKPFSLNKFIESELNQEVVHTTLAPKIEQFEPAAERFSLNKSLKPLNWLTKKYKETGTKINFTSLGKISPLKYRKTFQIKSPLKPNRVKHSLRTRHKRKNQSIKREIDENATLNKKYVPLLRSLGMLFDNILGTDSGESYEKTKHKKRLRYYPDDDDEVSCKCPRQREPNSKPESKEETVTFSEALAPKFAITTQVAAKTTDNPSLGNLRSFRQHQNVPLLLPRNTSSAWRNYHGDSERGSAAHNGSAERYISGNNGDSKYNPKHRQEQFYAESDEEYTDSASRNDASRIRTEGTVRGGRRREYGNSTEKVDENGAISKDEAEIFVESRENTTQYNGPNKLETERDEAKSGKFLSNPVRRQRGPLSNGKNNESAESIQPEENYKESVVSFAHDSSGSQRLPDGDGPHSSENKKVNTRTETVIYKLPEVRNRYSTTSTKATQLKGLLNDFAASEENDDNDKSNENISYDSYELKKNYTSNLTPTKDEETNTRSKTELLNKDHVVEQPSDILKKSTHTTLATDSVEGHPENKNEANSSTENGHSDDKLAHTYSTTKQTSPGTGHQSPEADISQYLSKPKTIKSSGPVVMITDGYSVTRHKNGENKLAEKAIRIRP